MVKHRPGGFSTGACCYLVTKWSVKGDVVLCRTEIYDKKDKVTEIRAARK